MAKRIFSAPQKPLTSCGEGRTMMKRFFKAMLRSMMESRAQEAAQIYIHTARSEAEYDKRRQEVRDGMFTAVLSRREDRPATA